MSKTISIILAYVGILTGAGLASGQELLQYFLAFGKPGIIALAVVGLMHFLLGGAILQLGSHYQATSHIDVLDEVSLPFIGKFLDYALVFTCFVFGFVMIAGAGSNLNQEFGLSPWIGSLICTIMIITIGMLDIDKVTKVIGAFTPLILVFVLIASVYTFKNADYDFDHLDAVARTLTPNTANPFIATINYFAMCIMSAASMAFVLGGSSLNSKKSGKGGLVGGFLVGLLGLLIGFTMFLDIDLVKNADIPMQLIVRNIHPVLGRIMALVIYGMIFNTAISLFYSLARRFAGENENKFRVLLIGITILAFGVSFLGFKQLVAIFYPIIGYIGIVLVSVLVIARLKNKEEIGKENDRRTSIMDLTRRKVDEGERFTYGDNRQLEKYARDSIIDDQELIHTAEDQIRDENYDDYDDYDDYEDYDDGYFEDEYYEGEDY